MAASDRRIERNKLRNMSKEDIARTILPDQEDIEERIQELVNIKSVLSNEDQLINEGIELDNIKDIREDVDEAIKAGDVAVIIYGNKGKENLLDVEVTAISMSYNTIETKISSISEYMGMLDLTQTLKTLTNEIGE